MIYELHYTDQYKNQFQKFNKYKKDILKIHNILTVNPFSGRYRRVKDPDFINFYCTDITKIRIFWKVQRGNKIILAGIVMQD